MSKQNSLSNNGDNSVNQGKKNIQPETGLVSEAADSSFADTISASISNATETKSSLVPDYAPFIDSVPNKLPNEPKFSAQNKRKKRIVLLSVSGGLALILVVLFIFSYWLVYMCDTVYPGVTALSTHFAGFTKAQTSETLEKMSSSVYGGKKITITCGDKSMSISTDELHMKFDIQGTVDKLYEYGRNGSFLTRLSAIMTSAFHGVNLPVSTQYEKGVVSARILAFEKLIDKAPVEPSYRIHGDVLKLTMGYSGLDLHPDALTTQVLTSLDKAQFDNISYTASVVECKQPDIDGIYEKVKKDPIDASVIVKDQNNYTITPAVPGRDFDIDAAKDLVAAAKPAETIEIRLTPIAPSITADVLSSVSLFTDTLASVSTYYHTSEANRTHNLSLAAKACNLTVINSGDEFSFNSVVGPRTEARGFKEARIFAGGEIVDGLGGGICQVSSSLYMAALRAELTITARSSHRFAITYTPLGQDATVVYGSVDFKFKNNTNYPIYLGVSASGGKLMVSIYGTKLNPDPNRTIELYSKTLSTTPYETKTIFSSDLKPGHTHVKQGGIKGYSCEVWRIVKENGAEVSRSLVNRSTYKACNRIIEKGPGTSAAATQKPSATSIPTATPKPPATAKTTAVPVPTANPAQAE